MINTRQGARPVRRYDMVVCGAGPGGVGAALSAARLGKRVLLVEQLGCAGGYLTSGMMGIALDMPGKGGIPREIYETLAARGAARWVNKTSYTYDIEAMKGLLEGLLLDAGVEVLLYTAVTEAKTGAGRIEEVVLEGFESLRCAADYFVDGTGHGTLSMLAGCGYDMGHPERKALQPGSLHALVTGVPEAWVSDIHNPERKRALYALLQSVGVSASYPAPLLFQPQANKPVWILAITHQYGVTAEDAGSVSLATLRARAEIVSAVDALRTLPGWEGLSLCATADQIGLRDGRRIHGRYTVTTEDALAGRAFPDGVVPIHHAIDVHQLTAQDDRLHGERGLRFQPFQIPLGSLMAKDVDNLFLVGRCISGEFLPHSAYRMTCSACAMGEAVGIAAQLAGPMAHVGEVDGAAVRAEMVARGYGL